MTAKKKARLEQSPEPLRSLVRAMDLIQKGASAELAAAAYDLPSAERARLQQVTRQLEARKEFNLMQLIATAAERDWRAAAWLLERRFPEQWSRQVERPDPDAALTLAPVPRGGTPVRQNIAAGAAHEENGGHIPTANEWQAMLWRVAERHEGRPTAALALKAAELALAHLPKAIHVPGWALSPPETPTTPALPAKPDDDDPSWT
jgi:hypothetical protein